MTETELETLRSTALGIMDALESRFAFISAYEDVGGCLTDEAISEITQRVEYFMDQSGTYLLKHTFSNVCSKELTKLDERESQKICSFLLYTYLTIEEKRYEILTIMMALLSNSEVYEELNQGYLKVVNHQKETLITWLNGTFSKPDTYCGLFMHHVDSWGNKKNLQHVQNIIFHFAPTIKNTEAQCLDTSKYLIETT